MARLVGLCGFTGGFLVIAPHLRQALLDAANDGISFVQSHSPYSYVGIVLLAFGAVTVTLVSGSSPR